MDFAWIVGIGIAGLCAAGLWLSRRDARALREALTRVARSTGGTIHSTAITMPNLCFERDGLPHVASAMHGGGGTTTGARSSQSYVEVYLSPQVDARFQVIANGLVAKVQGLAGRTVRTGHDKFDARFAVIASDADVVRRVFDASVRRALLAWRGPPEIEVTLTETTLFENGRLVFGEKRPRLGVSIDEVSTDPKVYAGLLDVLDSVRERVCAGSPAAAR